MSAVCSTCGQEERAGGTFCAGCGAAIVTKCPVCERPVDSVDRYCAGCGAALTTTPTGPLLAASVGQAPGTLDPAERKQITVLFADVEGSLELQEQLDVETWADIVHQFVNILAD